MSRLISALILLALIIIFAGFAVINRDSVRVSFDFFSLGNSSLAYEAPLFLVILAAGLTGMVFGMALLWIDRLHKKQMAWRDKLWKQGKEKEKKEIM